jgi:hypothetical protein
MESGRVQASALAPVVNPVVNPLLDAAAAQLRAQGQAQADTAVGNTLRDSAPLVESLKGA